MRPPYRFDPVDLLTLHGIRTFIRDSSARGGVVFFALLYGLGAAFSSGMVLISSIPGGYTLTVLWSGGPGTSFWNYPGLLLVAPWGVVSAPFFPTLAMVFVSVGVGLGMTVAFLLAVQLVRDRRRFAGTPTATGTIAGLTPAMITLVTLGACCSTTAAASAGVGVVALVTGTTTNNLLLNNWFLGVFQIVVVWVALIAQELLLVVYTGLFTKRGANTPSVRPVPVDRRSILGGALRAALLVGGVLWSLSMLAEWTTVSPGSASAGLWFQWIVQHQLLALLAIAAALFPTGTWSALRVVRQRAWPLLVGALLVAGLTVLWSPPPLSSWGLDGLVNQVLFTLHAPASWGTVSPGGLGGLALGLRWLFEYALLGGFAVAAALAPDRTFAPLRWWSAGRAGATSPPAGLPSPSVRGPSAGPAEGRVVDPVNTATSASQGP
jgi:hypothetical protein